MTPTGRLDDGAQRSGPGRPATTFCMTYVRVVGGAFEMASDPAEPWVCFDMPMDAWVDPTPTNFD